MVSFGSGMNYYMPMDREYGSSAPKPKDTGDVGLGIGDIGMSLGLGPVQNIPVIGAKLRGGTKIAELTFMGAGKGSGQGHTPEMYGEMQRQALREMQKANEVRFTTHASVGVYGLAGMDQQGNFSKHAQGMAIDEIKRAIDFAADVARGGSVVVHTGEFHRPVAEAEWNKNKQFRMFEGEEERTSFKVVDTRTGGIIQEARKNRAVSKPVWKTANAGEEYIDFDDQKKKANGQEETIYLDYWGHRLKRHERVPEYDSKTGIFKVRQVGWNDLIREAKEMTTEARDEIRKYHEGKLTPEEINHSIWINRFKDLPKNKIDEIEVKPEEAYIISTLETNAANSRGWAYNYSGQFDEHVKAKEKLEKALKLYQEIEKSTDEEEKWKLKKEVRGLAGGLVPMDAEMPAEIIEKELRQVVKSINTSKESSASQLAQSEELRETIKFVESAESYALREAKEAYAAAAMTAMMKTEQLEKKGALKKPLFVAMENLFPESYGAHPDELIDLVKGSQEKMKQQLMQKGFSENEAQKRAETHIGATFDTGHFNMWKKYWRGDPNKNIEENEKGFSNWFLNQVEKLAKSGVVKHIHMVDNYGYQDEHLAPGQGNTPIKEAVEIFKKNGFKGDFIVEGGADYSVDSSGFNTMTKAWRYMGNTIYGGSGGGAASRRWEEVQSSYFGHNAPPYFVFGAYSPSEEWTLWSGTPLE